MVQAHKITLLVVDHDEIGADEVADVLRNQRYPNRCISPRVMGVRTVEVEWDDDHPLNRLDTMEAEFHRLFPEGGEG